MFTYSPLDEAALDRVRRLEAEIGTPVLALTKLDARPAEIDPAALAKVEALESELGLVLVAARP